MESKEDEVDNNDDKEKNQSTTYMTSTASSQNHWLSCCLHSSYGLRTKKEMEDRMLYWLCKGPASQEQR